MLKKRMLQFWFAVGLIVAMMCLASLPFSSTTSFAASDGAYQVKEPVNSQAVSPLAVPSAIPSPPLSTEEAEPAGYCGDHETTGLENCQNCPADAGVCPPLFCGDHYVSIGETYANCPQDVPPPFSTRRPIGWCGDGICQGGPNACKTCPQDCGVCPPVVSFNGDVVAGVCTGKRATAF
jgi:hypothetical protein